jgi:ABC-type transporter Mla subunit MlaD
MMRAFNRPVSHAPSPATIIIAALLALGLLGGLVWVALVAPRGVPFLRYYNVDAQFRDASQIADLSQVRIAGRGAGQVLGSSVQGGVAVVRMALYPGQKPLRSDSTARIRLKGLLGAKFVEITPGRTGRPLRSGSTLPISQTSSAIDLLTVLQAFDAPTRLQLQTAVRGLGQGFLGRGPDINRMLTVAPGFYGRTGQISQSILAQTGGAARFAPSAESLAGAYDPVREELATGFAPQASVLQAFVDKTSQLQQTLDAAPPSLQALRQGLDAATPLLDQTAGLARATITLTGPAPAALRQASAFLRDAAPALRVTGPPLQRLADAVPQTLGFLNRVDPVIRPAVVAMQKSVGSLLELGRHSCDVLSFARNWRSTLGYGVATGTGPLAAGEPGLGPLNSLRVVAVRLLSELNADAPPVGGLPKNNPYPAPCVSISEH